MSEPIPVQVTRYRCPSCGRSANSRSRTREHMARCWLDPENRGCKTCRCFWQGAEGEGCAKGVDLSGRPACTRCAGSGWSDLGASCPDCDNSPEARDEVKAGPIIHCDLWQDKDEE